MEDNNGLIFCDTLKAKMTREHCKAIHKKIEEDDASYLSYETLLKCRKCNNR